jgi:hypothetical protein
MTIEKRLSRLEGIVERLATHTTAFIQAATESNVTLTAALQTHVEEIRRHSEEQGPQNSHRRKGNIG